MPQNSMNYVEQAANGEWRLVASRVALEAVIVLWKSGQSPEAIAHALPSVAAEEVYGAIAFYMRHQTEIDAEFTRKARPANEPTQKVNAPVANQSALTTLYQQVYDALWEGNGKPSAAGIARINDVIAQHQLPYDQYRGVINDAFAKWYRENPDKSRFANVHNVTRDARPSLITPGYAVDVGDWGGDLIDGPQLAEHERLTLHNMVWRILERTDGNPPDADAAEVEQLCRKYRLTREQARHHVGTITRLWEEQHTAKHK